MKTHNAMHAAASGFDFGKGYSNFEDDFTGPSEMTRRGTMELENKHGELMEIDFEAKFAFGKPRTVAEGKSK